MTPHQVCKRTHCELPAVYNELCSEHLEEARAAKELRARAVRLLHGNAYFENPPLDRSLEAEFQRAMKWWDRGCSAVNAEREDEVLKSETAASLEWFVQIAISIDHDNNEIARGCSPSGAQSRSDYWARLEKLESEAGKR